MGLTPEQSKFFEQMDEVFATEGWRKLFIEDMYTRYERSRDLLVENENLTSEYMHFLKGGLAVLKSILDYEQEVNVTRRLAEEQDEEEEDSAEAAL